MAYLFDEAALERGELRVAYRIPSPNLTSLSEQERRWFAKHRRVVRHAEGRRTARS